MTLQDCALDKSLPSLSQSSSTGTMTKVVESPPPDHDMATTLVSRCSWSDLRVQGCIGDGSFAMVVKADYNSETIAVKTLRHGDLDSNMSTQALKDLKQEAKLLTKLNHPHIVSIVSTGQRDRDCDDSFFIGMECLEEDTLETRISQWGRTLQAASTSKILRQRVKSIWGKNKTQEHVPSLLDRLSGIGLGLCQALHYLHENQIVHCDIKPANVGFAKDPRAVKLFDFGLSQDLSRSTSSGKSNGDAFPLMVGSFRYMAPEVLLAHPVRYASDIYSLGLLLWSLVTLEKPHKDSRSLRDIINTVVLEDGRPNLGMVKGYPDEVSTAGSSRGMQLLRQLLLDCWKPEPSDRPSSKQLLEDMEKVISTLRIEVDQQQKEHGYHDSPLKKNETRTRNLRMPTWKSVASAKKNGETPLGRPPRSPRWRRSVSDITYLVDQIEESTL